jgi:hypothetical protein
MIFLEKTGFFDTLNIVALPAFVWVGFGSAGYRAE